MCYDLKWDKCELNCVSAVCKHCQKMNCFVSVPRHSALGERNAIIPWPPAPPGMQQGRIDRSGRKYFKIAGLKKDWTNILHLTGALWSLPRKKVFFLTHNLNPSCKFCNRHKQEGTGVVSVITKSFWQSLYWPRIPHAKCPWWLETG